MPLYPPAGGAGGIAATGTTTVTNPTLVPSGTGVVGATINAPAGQTADLLDLDVNSVIKFKVDSGGVVTAAFIGSSSGMSAVGTVGANAYTSTAGYFDSAGTAASRLFLNAVGTGLNGNAPVAKAGAIATPTSDTVGTKAAIDAIRVALANIGITA